MHMQQAIDVSIPCSSPTDRTSAASGAAGMLRDSAAMPAATGGVATAAADAAARAAAAAADSPLLRLDPLRSRRPSVLLRLDPLRSRLLPPPVLAAVGALLPNSLFRV
jgi:hypothetical protein